MNSIIKKFGVLAAISSLLLLAALAPCAAFAEDAASGTATTAAASETEASDALIAGKVTKVTKSDDGVAITLDDGKGGIVLNISEPRFVYDQKAKAYASLDDVKEGIRIAAVLPKNAPLALSAPPQTGAVFGLILNEDAGTIKLDVFDEELLSGDKSLKLNISKDTLIGKDTGEKRVFTADDLKNEELIVFYEVVTTSLPAQTAPKFVLILSEAPVASAPEEAPEESAPVVYVGLRAAAEAKGYTVTWVSNARPITLSKAGVTATVTIGTDAFTYTHLTKDIQPLDSAEKLDLATRLVGGKTEVASSFIDLLP
ncbi:MAG: copper amine oxidase N-terminal domain-containing protein [Clostridiales Family XIII bacterium]|jgi:hypothetical protein|nr:copper amine oxidase N-terminal domain-containing protein [Clostridiales Family XIII bacterium]